MNLFSALLLLASADPAAAAPGASQAQPKGEKKICRRIDATESRTASKRFCKTASEWKEYDAEGGDYEMSRDTRLRKN